MDFLRGFLNLLALAFVVYTIHALTTPSKPLPRRMSKKRRCISCDGLLSEGVLSICIACELRAGEE